MTSSTPSGAVAAAPKYCGGEWQSQSAHCRTRTAKRTHLGLGPMWRWQPLLGHTGLHASLDEAVRSRCVPRPPCRPIPKHWLRAAGGAPPSSRPQSQEFDQ